MQTLTIIGRRWFQKTYGNTYHSAIAVMDGVTVLNTGRHYGYGDQYLQTAFEQLEAKGLIQPPKEPREAIWQWAERAGVALTYTATDVSRERDL